MHLRRVPLLWVADMDSPLPIRKGKSAADLPVDLSTGRVLLVGSPTGRGEPLTQLSELGYGCDEMDDPYTAFAELCRRPLAFRAVALGLAGIYREELQMIASIRRLFPHIDVWLAQTEGRCAAMAEGLRLGADGILSDDGLHRVGASASPLTTAPSPVAPAEQRSVGATAPMSPTPQPTKVRPPIGEPESYPRREHAVDPRPKVRTFEQDVPLGEPVLSAEELRALLEDTH